MKSSFILGVCLFICVFTLFDQYKSAFVPPTGWVQIQTKKNLCIRTANNAKLKEGNCLIDPEYLWKFEKHRDYYFIVNKKNRKVFDVRRSYKWNGARILAYSRHRYYNQRWKLESRENGKFFRIRSVLSKRCLTFGYVQGKKKNGKLPINYYQWDCWRFPDNNEFRTLTPLAAPTGWTQIGSPCGLCIHGWKGNGVDNYITQGPCDSSESATWKFEKMGQNYVVVNKSGKVFDVFFSKKGNGEKILAYERRDHQKNQKWNFINIEDGKFMLKNLNSGRCLDYTAVINKEKVYHQMDCKPLNINQYFSFVPVAPPKYHEILERNF
jgi:hypothetical protein